MKSLFILLMAACTLLSSNIANAQKAKSGQDKTNKVSVYTCPKHPSISLSKSGTCPECGAQLVLSGKEMMKREIVKSYTCPMHPEVASKSPGKCPKCNMALTVQKH
jgi:transcription initiation factor IIE alpha subunit